MTAVSASASDVMRRAIAKMDPEAVMQVVDTLQLKGAKLSAVIAVPLRNLQKKRDVAAFAALAPIDAVAGLLELFAVEPLEKVIEALGDDAESPSYDQLLAAVSALRVDALSIDQIVAVLAFAIGHDFPAAPHCRRLFSEDAELSLPELDSSATHTPLLSPKVVDETVREQRRARREEEKARKLARAAKAKAETPGPRSKTEKKKSVRVDQPVTQTLNDDAPVLALLDAPRRSLVLTPSEAALYDAAHPLSGWVVTTEVPFDNVDPVIAEQQSKIRPALVVAASDEGLLVRGIYTNSSPTRTLFTPWRRLGLDHVSYIDVARSPVDPRAEVTRVGAVSDEEWNALL